jgi:hypothetical protein
MPGQLPKRSRRALAGLLLALFALSATGAGAGEDDCAVLRERLDARIDAAAVGDPRHYRLPAAPWLRTDRFLLDAWRRAGDTDTRSVIAARMARFDAAALDRELARLPADGRPDPARLERCRAQARAAAPGQGAAIAATRLPDGYARWKRLLGLYPVARPFLAAGVEDWQQGERAAIAAGPPPVAATLAGPPTDGADAAAETRTLLAEARRAHALGWPLPAAAPRDRLLALHAPALALPSPAPADRPGRLAGVGGRPVTRPEDPVADTDVTLVRWGGQVLLQLVYVFWFPERPPAFPLDPYAGRIDGLVWRVTLADDGRPLLWDSIHPCGCFHTVAIPSDRRLTPKRSLDREAPLYLEGPPATAAVRLRFASGTHLLRAVEPAATGAADGRYRLAPFAERLAADDRPPFGPDGLLAGTGRGERLFLWPSGIASPGAMRSLGRHATAFVGRARFETATLLDDRLYVRPPASSD